MPCKPMLAFKHKRRWDRSLAIRTFKTNEGEFFESERYFRVVILYREFSYTFD